MENEIGVLVPLRAPKPDFAPLVGLGLKACQLVSWKQEDWTDQLADSVRAACQESGVRVTSFWSGWPGPKAWNFTEGPSTLGVVPPEYRAERVAALKRGAAFAKRAGLPAIITHLGFIPENPKDANFPGVVEAVREVAIECEKLGIEFWFETGQETPVALLRLIQSVGTNNLGINLDPANLILYGKANPIDALDVFGKYVKNIHAKDGMYPTDPNKLGHEVKVGQGRVRFPEFVKRLHEVGFTGEFIIEREISGEQQRIDIADTVKYLESLLK